MSFEMCSQAQKKTCVTNTSGSTNGARQRESATEPSWCSLEAPSERTSQCESVAPVADAQLPRGVMS